MRFVVFDIETISPNSVRGRVNAEEQELTIVGVYDSATDSYSSYTKEELPKLWPLLDAAATIL